MKNTSNFLSHLSLPLSTSFHSCINLGIIFCFNCFFFFSVWYFEKNTISIVSSFFFSNHKKVRVRVKVGVKIEYGCADSSGQGGATLWRREMMMIMLMDRERMDSIRFDSV